jgi:hypothetical protein
MTRFFKVCIKIGVGSAPDSLVATLSKDKLWKTRIFPLENAAIKESRADPTPNWIKINFGL